MPDTFAAGEKPTATKLNRALGIGTVIARAERTTSSSTTTTSYIGVLRLDDVPITSGRIYEVHYEVTPNSSVTGDGMATKLTYTIDGSTPGLASPTFPDSFRQGVDEAVAISWNKSALYVPLLDQTLSVMLCVARISGSGNVNLFADADRKTSIWIIDCGLDPGDSGVSL